MWVGGGLTGQIVAALGDEIVHAVLAGDVAVAAHVQAGPALTACAQGLKVPTRGGGTGVVQGAGHSSSIDQSHGENLCSCQVRGQERVCGQSQNSHVLHAQLLPMLGGEAESDLWYSSAVDLTSELVRRTVSRFRLSLDHCEESAIQQIFLSPVT